MPDQERVKVTVRLKPALLKRVQHFAIDHGTSVQALVEEALELLLKRGR